jgi:hypothetical protein
VILTIALLVAPSYAQEGEPVPPQVEDAVDRALAWLADNQQPTGTWSHGGNSKTAIPSLRRWRSSPAATCPAKDPTASC